MRTSSKWNVVSLLTAMSAGTAFADDPPATDPAPTVSASTADAAAPASRYPRDVMSRVLTYPKGLASLGLDVSSLTSSFADPAFVRPVIGYGITDELEINFGAYAFPANKDAAKGSLDAGAGYAFVRGAMDGKLEIVARAQVGYSLASEAMNPLALGAHAQYNITPKLCVLTPGGQLAFGLSDPNPISFNAPVAVGVQPTPELYLQLDTKLAQINVKDSASAYLFADTTPIALTAIYNAIPALDLMAVMSVDATPPPTMDATGASVDGKASDTLSVLIGARYYMGKL